MGNPALCLWKAMRNGKCAQEPHSLRSGPERTEGQSCWDSDLRGLSEQLSPSPSHVSADETSEASSS